MFRHMRLMLSILMFFICGCMPDKTYIKYMSGYSPDGFSERKDFPLLRDINIDLFSGVMNKAAAESFYRALGEPHVWLTRVGKNSHTQTKVFFLNKKSASLCDAGDRYINVVLDDKEMVMKIFYFSSGEREIYSIKDDLSYTLYSPCSE